jgi:hypothetical protein
METKMVTINETKVFFVFTLWLAQKGARNNPQSKKESALQQLLEAVLREAEHGKSTSAPCKHALTAP